MTPNPILKVLSTFSKFKVKSLLIGGQAAIIYGAAEFSRDSDFVILCSPENIENLKKALKALKAENIYVPPLEIGYLQRGHACHFRCKARDTYGLRVDIISKLRGCDPFDKLWRRKDMVSLKKGEIIYVLGLKDLAQSKKTQRDKDWLMLKRLVENDIILRKDNPSAGQIKWWLSESRNAETLLNLVQKYPEIAKECVTIRPLLREAIAKNMAQLNLKLNDEEAAQRQKDIEYWAPLRKELEALRHEKSQELPLRAGRGG